MNLSEQLARDTQENADQIKQSSGWFKFKEGKNVIRVLTCPVPLFEDYDLGICYTDCGFQGDMKYLCHVIDRTDNKPKLWKMGVGLFKELAGLQTSSRFPFEAFPMPYDLEINAKGAGTKKVEYSVLPGIESPVQVPDKLTPCTDVIEKLKEKNKAEHEADGTRARILDERRKTKEFLDSKRPQAATTAQPAEAAAPAAPTPATATAPALPDQPGYPTEDINPEDIPF